VTEGREDADVETSSESYARRFAGPVGAFFLERQGRTTLELLRPFPGASVLDVGGGHGQLTGLLVDAGHSVMVFGSDAACGERVRPWTDRGRAEFRSGELLALPFGDRSFDVVLAFRLLPHVRRWPDLVGELTRVARRAVIVDYPTTRSVNALARASFGLKQSVEGNTRPFLVFKDTEIEAALAAHGFRSAERRGQFLFPMALHRMLGSAPTSRALEAAGRVVGLTRSFGSPVILRVERA
jgi:2-polyprenyl-3-methyl-5-hydroxy-6-metoxy-1,4-benzoquinol methylase